MIGRTQNGRSPLPMTAGKTGTAFDEEGVRRLLYDLSFPCFLVENGSSAGLSNRVEAGGEGYPVYGMAPALGPEDLGDPAFREAHGARCACYAGAMANGIASEEMVIALGRAGLMGSFGAAGLPLSRVEEAIIRIREALPQGPFLFNLIHSPHEPALEAGCVDLYLKHGVRGVEAAAFLGLTPHVVRYRAAGLSLSPEGRVIAQNRIVAKVSRREVAEKFMEPAPGRILSDLAEKGLISAEQARLARSVPMADDISVEADSGGHTDNRPLVSIFPAIQALRDEIQARHGFETPIRVGAAGGVSTPASALAAFAMGAAYVVTGSVNQACVESGAGPHTKALLAKADMADVVMAPAADMFEMGVKVQVLKRGTLFPMRARKLFEIYSSCGGLSEIPPAEREKLEKQVFHMTLDQVWDETREFFSRRDPAQIQRAEGNPKRKMALVFRWYLGLSSRWSNCGEAGREMDYQIWCGPSMGAFNAWVKGGRLEAPENRRVAEVAEHILRGAAVAHRIHALRAQGALIPPGRLDYRP